MHGACEHRARPWSIGSSHRTKSSACYKAGLQQEATQPSSHMQDSEPKKDPGPGTQTQAALLEEQLKSQIPSGSIHRPLETLAHTHVGGEGAAMARPRGLKGQCTLGKSCISTGDMLHGRAGRKETSF